MKNESKRFLEFNGKVIYFVAADGQYWIALKPICEALGVDFEAQRKNLKEDEILSLLPSEQTVVAADNKLRKMLCLPEFYVYGWIFNIQSSSLELLKYKWECYGVLYEHFHGMITQREQILKIKTLDELEIERLETELEDSVQYKKIQELRSKNKRMLNDLRKLDKSLVDSQLDIWKQQ